MAGTSDKYSDDYVAEILQKDAKATSKEYKDLGMSAFLPKRYGRSSPCLTLLAVR